MRYRGEMKHKKGTDPQILLSVGEVTRKERRNKGFAEPQTKGRQNEGEAEAKTKCSH